MSAVPTAVEDFLSGSRFAVAGVSRDSRQPANAIFRRLRDAGHEVVPINPAAVELEGAACYPDLASVPGPLDGVVIATHPDVAEDVVRQCPDRDVHRVWFHRSIGQGSVSDAAIEACKELDLTFVEGGCPLMFCEPVDLGHKCMRWFLQRRGKVPR